jgi:Xaa-Pro aminopeptidase
LADEQTRVERLRALLHEQQLVALYVTDPYNRRYLSGFHGTAGSLLIARDEAVIAVDFRYWEQAERQAPGIRLLKAVGPNRNWIAELFAGLGGRRVGFEAGHLTYAGYREIVGLIEELPAASRPQFVPAQPLVEQLREIKDTEELRALEEVVALGDAAFQHVAERIAPGWTELQAARLIEDYIRDHGGQGTSFEPIVAGGARGAMPHARAGHDALREGEGVVIDMGALLNGYCSDMTRTIVLGEPDPRFAAIYDIVLTAQLTAEELIEPGMTGDQAHQLAKRVIEEAGHGDEFGHGLGHGVGLQVHESPWLRPESTSVLREGQVFSVEPGIYITGWGGVRIEDLVVLENGKCRVLSRAPKIRLTGVTA